MHVGWRNANHKCKLGEGRLESSRAERDLEVLSGSGLSVSQQCALAGRRARHILGCITPSMTCHFKEVIFLLESALVPAPLAYWVQF